MYIPIGTLPGITSQLDDVDVLVGTLGVATTVTRVMLRHTDYDDGGATDTSVTGTIRNATAGGGDGIAFSILDQTQSITATGSMAVSASESIYLRVSAGSASMNLTGWVEVEAASGVTTALTNLSRVKAFLGITASTNDALLTTLINGVSAEIQQWLSRDIVQATETNEKKTAWGGDDAIYLRHYPIVSVTTVTEDGTALVEDTDFEHTQADDRAGRLARISGGDPYPWTTGTRNIAVTYAHGFATVPEGLAQAATELVAHDFRSSTPGGARLALSGNSLDTGGTSGYTSRAAAFADQLTRLLPYRRKDA